MVPRAGHADATAADSDGDGVADGADRCPGRAGLAPDGCPPRDSDGDGLVDRRDRCPQQAGPIGHGGCPDSDRDGDGVVDRRDRCRDRVGHSRFAGCPAPDSDGDGVADPDDQCSDKTEVWNGRRDGDGCPDRGGPVVSLDGHRVSFAAKPRRLFRASGSLSKRGQSTARIAAALLRAIHARRVRVVVVPKMAKKKLDKIRKQAQKRARALAERLGRYLARKGAELLITAESGSPAATERVELVFE